MKVLRTRNNGNPNWDFKPVDVSNMNIAPDTIVATASGTTFDVSLLDNYDTFNVARTSADTDLIVLPATIPVGSVLRFISSTALKFRCPASGGIGINNGADTTSISMASGALMVIQKISATKFIANQYAAAGTVTAPTPA